MNYEFDLLELGDADAIIIGQVINDQQYITLVDAGNEGDGKKIKAHLQKYYNTTTIDLAICTHADGDHKGGFFDLLQDPGVTIHEFWLADPALYLGLTGVDIVNARKIFDSADGKQNLIDLVINKCDEDKALNVTVGTKHEVIPIAVIGPCVEYMKSVLQQAISTDVTTKYEDEDTEEYDEAAKVDDDEVKSVIDKENDDPSPFNCSSLVLLYDDGIDKFLLAGDASRASLTEILTRMPEMKGHIAYFKVPHHGSKHNLTTVIIDDLKPKQSFISAAGNKKHPNQSIAYCLSNYGDVYSTHLTHSYIHHRKNGGIVRPGEVDIDPYRKKK